MADERIPKSPKQITDIPQVGSEGQPNIFVMETFTPNIVDLSDGAKIKIENGSISIDRQALEDEHNNVLTYLKNAIDSGNEVEVAKFLWYLEDSQDEAGIDLRNKINTALKNRDSSSLSLKNISVVMPSKEIAQRRLIKEALRTEITNIPFSFKDKNGDTINTDNIDFIFVVDVATKNFKLIVASQFGIDSVSVEEVVDDTKFKPDFNKITKDTENDYIIIPLLPAEDGIAPPFGFLEIRKGKIDLPQQISEDEEKNFGKPDPRPFNSFSTPFNSNNNIYSPSPPSPAYQPRSQRSSSYVTVSH
jgi:hypothetical protein